MNSSTINDCHVIELDRHHSNRKGNITVVENNSTIPFDIKRAYYLYDIPGGEERGAHAHRQLRQLIIAASGCFDVILDDGYHKKTFTLNRPYQGLYVVPGIWRELNNFSSGSVCLVLASETYDEADYIRDYPNFLGYKKKLLPSDFETRMYGIDVRLVNENDAAFILKLRTDPHLSQFIHDTSPDIELQIQWIHNYKQREKEGLDYYFIFSRDNKPFALNRLYSIRWKDKIFTSGSWLCTQGTSVNDVVASSIIPRNIAFDTFGMELENGYDGCHRDNRKVLKFNKMIGMVISGTLEDTKGIYYTMTLTKEDFVLNRAKIEKLLNLQR